jgi:GMP synthase-like glutamine amidotransferase
MILVIKHISIEGPGIIGEFFNHTTQRIKTIDLEENDELPEDFSKIEAVIILGGPMNVYEEDKFPFLRDEDIFLKKAIRKEIPLLGICLGAQLLAKACGAKVKRASVEEIGWYKISLTEEGKKDALFKDIGKELDVFQWHEDTFEIPEGATLLATSDGTCKNQAFRFGKSIYGLQFHIEVTPKMLESWVRCYLDRDKQIELDAQKMLIDNAYRKKEQFVEQAHKILLNFSRIMTKEVISAD